MKRLVSLLFVCLLVFSSAAMAQTRGNEPTENFIPIYRVDAFNGSDLNDGKNAPFKTITKALQTVAGTAAYIICEPGRYGLGDEPSLPLSIPSGVVLTSRLGAGVTTLYGGHQASLLDFNGTQGAVVSGFHIFGGDGYSNNPAVTQNGGAVRIRNGASSVTLENNHFDSNWAYGAPGTAAHPVGGNANGGAVYVDASSSCTIRNNVFVFNRARGGKGLSSASPAVGGVAQGGALYALGQVTLIHNTFARNEASGGPGGDGTGVPGAPGGERKMSGAYLGGAGTVANNLFYGNYAYFGKTGSGPSGPGGNGAYKIWDFTADLSTVTHNLYSPFAGQIVYPNSVVTNDPHIVGQQGHYEMRGHIKQTSPARAAASPAYPLPTDNQGITRPSPASIGALEPRTKFDADRDGMADLIWRHAGSGDNAVWLMNGGGIVSSSFTDMLAAGFTIAGTGDFDADAKTDIFWRNPVTGVNAIWTMNGTQVLKKTDMQFVGVNWVISAVDDLNGDGTADVLWRSNAGTNWAWYLRGMTILRSVALPDNADSAKVVVGTGDFDNDGTADLYWRNPNTGATEIWFVNDIIVYLAKSQSYMGTAWKVAGIGDFYGDGFADVLWRNTITGENRIFNYFDGTLKETVDTLHVADLNWDVLKVADFSGDGKADLFWRKADDGQLALWTMNGASLGSSVVLPVSLQDPNWKVAP